MRLHLFPETIFLFLSIFCTHVFGQEIIEEDLDNPGDSSTISAPAVPPRPVIHATPYAWPLIRSKNAQTIAGASLFFCGIALEYGVLTPWSLRFNGHLITADTVTSADAGEAIYMLLAAIPVSAVQIGGASCACAGASRVHLIYHETINSDVTDVRVWTPYVIGWIGRGAGSALGFFSGLAQNPELSVVASVLSISGQAAWTASTIMSLVYSSRWRGEAQMKLFIAPTYSPKSGTGLSLVYNF